jgi:hypothetical protein
MLGRGQWRFGKGWVEMTVQMLLMLATFILGAILTEIRWIGRVRRLRGALALHEAARTYGGERARLVAVAEAGVQRPPSHEDAQQSLRRLQQQLTAETPASQPSACSLVQIAD